MKLRLAAWVRISYGEMGRSEAPGSQCCVSEGLGGKENCRELLLLPCSLRGNEWKEVGLDIQVGARLQGHVMNRPMDFILHMKEVFSGFYTGEQQNQSYL